MHIEEVFKAINGNHKYEYFVIDTEHKVLEFSENILSLYDVNRTECDKLQMHDIAEELVGAEEEIKAVFEGTLESFSIPFVYKKGRYYNIGVHPGKATKRSSKAFKYRTVVVLLEDVNEIATAQQALIQEKNEKSLLLEEIFEKNRSLRKYNEKMQEMVKTEMARVLEKQKMIEHKARYIQMGEMVSMFTHQWKQPLNIISIIGNVLKMNLSKKNTKADKETIEKIDRILEQVEFMSKTITDFQHFFRPTKEIKPFDVCRAIDDVVNIVRFLFEYHGIDLLCKCEKPVIEAIGFPNEFKQVILTLLSNAKDACVANPNENLKVIVEAEEDEGSVKVRVKDNAGGIPETLIDKIFDLYVGTKEEGSGLGLTLAKNIIEKNMGGKISARNEEDGAVFEISLQKA